MMRMIRMVIHQLKLTFTIECSMMSTDPLGMDEGVFEEYFPKFRNQIKIFMKFIVNINLKLNLIKLFFLLILFQN